MEVEDYKLISSQDLSHFNSEAKSLVDRGYRPYGQLNVSFREMSFTDESYFVYSREFVKVKPKKGVL